MKIQKVEIKNFKALKNIETNLHGSNVFLVAPNGQGKTTFIDACFGVMPKQPLTVVEKKGLINIDLGDYVVEFKFTERNQKPKMNIFDKSGKPQKTPAKLFKQLFGITDFNIDEFLNQSVKKQIETIKKMIGIDWSDVDARFKELFDERTFKTRQAKEIDGEIAGRPFNIMSPVNVDDLQTELMAAIKNNENIEKVTLGIIERDTELKKVQSEIESLKLKSDELMVNIDKGGEWLKNKKIIDLSELQNSISSAAEHNAAFSANEKIGELREKSGVIWDEIEVIETEIKSIEQTKKNELESAVMPVRGLSFDDEQLYLDDLPFNGDQINTARRITAGLELQFQLMNDVKIARLDGSLLDKKTMAAVEKWADERKIQLFVELVDRDGDELKIEVSEESEPEPFIQASGRKTRVETKPEPFSVGFTFTHETNGLTVSGRGQVVKAYKIISIDGSVAKCHLMDDNSVMALSENVIVEMPLANCKNQG